MAEKKTAEQKKAEKARRENNLVERFQSLYLNQSKLQGWKQLCRDLGEPEGDSLTQCKKNLKGVYVNIFDFVAVKEAGNPVPRHKTLKALREYSYQNGLIFPLHKAKNNALLRGLLVHMSGNHGQRDG